MVLISERIKNVKLACSLGFFLLFLSTGCVSHFSQPMTNPGEQQLDAGILGTWYWHKQGESGYIHIGRDITTELLKIAMVELNANDEIKISQWSGHTSMFEDTRYLNLQWVYPEDKRHKGYLIFKYECLKDSFGFYFMKDSVIEDAVKEGVLRGELIKKGSSSSAWVTQDQKKLVHYIRQHHRELYTDFSLLPKLKLP